MKDIRNRENGFASFIMTIAFIILVTLLVTGFTLVARQNQEQSQNRQLSTQAFYAAESGVADASDFLIAKQKAGTLAADAHQDNCTSAPFGVGYTPSVGSSNQDVKYTCVLYQTAPRSLEYNLSKDVSRIVRVQSSDNTKNIDEITISWEDSGGEQTFVPSTSPQLLPQVDYTDDGGANLNKHTGIVRATLIPAGSLDRTSLTTAAQTVFLFPKAGAANSTGTVSYLAPGNSLSDQNQGVFSDGNCNKDSKPAHPRYCQVTIRGLNRAGSSTFYVRLRAMYRSSNVTISATNTDRDQVQLVNEQALIDSTGKANNVLRRIQVRIPLATTANRPEYAAETVDDFCKRLIVYPGGGQVLDPTGMTSPPSCQIN
ncbi:MAG: hypothetical protein WCJ24_02425 [Candidatus Saccharibacteria bacterium]